jgi:alpha-galactosidase
MRYGKRGVTKTNLGMSRRSFVQASLGAVTGLKALTGTLKADARLKSNINVKKTKPSGRIIVEDSSDKLILSNGMVTVICDKRSGLASFLWNGTQKVKEVYSSVKLRKLLKTTDYFRHKYDESPISLNDGIGRGLRFTIIHNAESQPDLLQHFTLYEEKPFFFIQAEVRNSQNLSTNYFGVFVVESQEGMDIGKINQNRMLRVPFDNDVWIRFEAKDINGNGSDVSSEATAIYDNASRNGLILGSVTHDTWKTGISSSWSNGRLDKLEVFGGMALEAYSPLAGALKATSGIAAITRDSLPHGKVSGSSVSSPVIFLGHYEDWRDGLEEYGRANAAIKAPLVWRQAIPFGWNSYAALAGHLNYSRYIGALDFIDQKLAPKGFHSGNVIYHNLDGGWQRLDVNQLRDALTFIRDLGRKTGIDYRAGIYMAPFTYRPAPADNPSQDNLDNFVEGTNLKYRFRDILLKKPDGTPLPTLDGSYPLDPTHPGMKSRIRSYITTFKDLGYQYIKIDFLAHGALEGVHWDKSVETGIQAYNQGMQSILDQVDGEMFLSLSLAPIFPGGYGHSRRISCDTMGHISVGPDAYPQQSTEYMLNSLTYGWWTSPSLYIADADQLPIGNGASIHGARTVNEARSRFLSAVICGGPILDSSDFFGDPTARELAPQVYTNPRVNALAGGKPFRPIEGDTGNRAAEVFVREEDGTYYLAVFNFDFDAGSSKQIPLERVARALAGANDLAVMDVWNNTSLGQSTGTLNVSLGPAESKLLKLTRA